MAKKLKARYVVTSNPPDNLDRYYIAPTTIRKAIEVAQSGRRLGWIIATCYDEVR